MKRSAALIFLVVWTALGVTGCLEVSQRFTVNPDRSAKVDVRMAIDLGVLQKLGSAEDLDMEEEVVGAEETLRSLAQQCVSTAEGVEAWTGYSLKREGRDVIAVSLTAYIPDLTEFHLNPDSQEVPNMTFTMTRDTEGRDRWEMKLPSINDFPGGDGGEAIHESAAEVSVVCEGGSEEKEKVETEVAGALEEVPAWRRPRLPEAELQAVVEDRRIQFEEEAADSKPLFQAMKVGAHLRFSGRIVEAFNVERLSRQEAGMVFRGERYYAMMETVVNDGALARLAFSRGAGLYADMALEGSWVNRWLFGQSGPVVVTVSPGQRPLFDYAAELALARGNPPPLELELGERE